ncbi:recombination protein RecR [candidate division WOR-3 bacterium]|nr:recombination protein RecR [candidate division WOR-3 bacterium]
MKPPGVFLRFIQSLQSLPGIGKKSAERIAFHILTKPATGEKILHSLEKVLSEIKFCSKCGNITIENLCHICSSHGRDTSIICVVEKPMDVFAIERSNSFKGLYHVLGGLLSPLDNTYPEDINIDSLIERVRTEGISEVIIATNPTTEGEATALYIEENLKDTGVKITRIARGIPFGTDIDFADDLTLTRALEDRQEFKE